MYEIFDKLCNKHRVTPYRVCKETGLTTSTISNWKAGRYTPKVDKLQKIADYFNVPISYFTGSEQEKTPSEKSDDEITFDDFTYAMYGESGELTEEQKEQLLEMAKFMKLQNKKKQKMK